MVRERYDSGGVRVRLEEEKSEGSLDTSGRQKSSTRQSLLPD